MTRNAKLYPALLATAALALAVHAQDDPRFGVMTHFAHGWDPTWTSAVVQISSPVIRDELYWQVVEPVKGRFVFPAAYDRYMAMLKQNHIDPLIVLSFENTNYDGGATPYTDAGIAAYARYAVEVLRHYGSQIKAVEIWNEYNGTFCKGPATQDRAGTYLRMLRATYAAIKRERPDVIVAGGSTSGIPLPYWTALLAGGGLACMDAISIHPYRYEIPPEGLEQDIVGLQNLVEKYNGGRPKPIWVTETGWFTKPSLAPGDLAIDDTTQAKFLVRAYALLLSADVDRVYWYLLHDYEGLAMGLFRDDANRTRKPAGTAMATMIQQLRDADFVRTEATPAGLYSLVFARPSGEEVRVLWALKPTTVAMNGAHSAVDFLGNPVALGASLTIGDGPLFVTGPLTRLPHAAAAAVAILADSVRGFSAQQGGQGWSYGVFVGNSTSFVPLTSFATSDWTQAWGSQYPYLALTAHDQHPSATGKTPVSAVRRWASSISGSVEITGQFRCGTQGDGVGVSILVNGSPRFRKLLGGKGGNPIVTTFDFTQPVQPGTLIDFAVDPGPSTDINYDATTVSVTINREAP